MPLTVLQLKVDAPLVGWAQLLKELNIRQLTDHLGRKAISAADARRLISMRRRQHEKAAEYHERRNKELARKHPVRAGGLKRPPEADPSMSAFEVMLAADAYKPDANKRTSPVEEFLLSELGPPRKVEGKRETR